MMSRIAWSLLFLAGRLSAQITDPKVTEVWIPEPPIIAPGEGTQPPSDAIVLLGGTTGLKEWRCFKDSSDAKWTLNPDGSMTVNPGVGDLVTRRVFGDCQIHLEYMEPPPVKGGQSRGNSGVLVQSRYELQLLDCYQNRTYSNGQAGAIYKQSIPLVNACRPPQVWQTYDILYTAPRFDADGILLQPAHITVLHNGVVIQLHTEIRGETRYIGLPEYHAHADAPLRLQDHGDLVTFRNIWIRKL